MKYEKPIATIAEYEDIDILTDSNGAGNCGHQQQGGSCKDDVQSIAKCQNQKHSNNFKTMGIEELF